MHVDEARRDYQALSIDDTPGLRLSEAPDGLDLAAPDTHVGVVPEPPGAVYDRSALDQRVQRHVASPYRTAAQKAASFTAASIVAPPVRRELGRPAYHLRLGRYTPGQSTHGSR